MKKHSVRTNVLALTFAVLCMYQSAALLSYAEVDASVLGSILGF